MLLDPHWRADAARSLDTSMRANMQRFAQRRMNVADVCVGYARDY